MDFARVAEAMGDWGFMTPWQGRQVYDHLRATGARDVLEIGTAYGVSAAYMAAAVAANGGGRVTTVDRNAYADPSPEEVLARAGLTDHVELVRVEHSSYDWWLKDEVLRRRPEDAVLPDPLYDFCYLDGSHEWHMDGLAVVLVEQLLRPGAWLLLDDVDWTWAGSKAADAAPPLLSAAERTQPPIRAVWETVVKPHPHFTELRLQDESWGWARKAPGAPKTLTVQETTDRSDILVRRAKMALGRWRAARG